MSDSSSFAPRAQNERAHNRTARQNTYAVRRRRRYRRERAVEFDASSASLYPFLLVRAFTLSSYAPFLTALPCNKRVIRRFPSASARGASLTLAELQGHIVGTRRFLGLYPE